MFSFRGSQSDEGIYAETHIQTCTYYNLQRTPLQR